MANLKYVQNKYEDMVINGSITKIDGIPKYIKKMAQQFDIHSFPEDVYVSYELTNCPIIVVNTIRRLLMSEIISYAYNKHTFTDFNNMSQINDEIIKDQMEFYTEYNLNIQEPIKISVNDDKCTAYAIAVLGKGINHCKWQTIGAYYKFMTNFDDSDDHVETLNDQREYIKTNNGSPHKIILTLEKLKPRLNIYDPYKNISITDINNVLPVCIKILIHKFQKIINSINNNDEVYLTKIKEEKQKLSIEGNFIILDDEYQTLVYLLESIDPNIKYTTYTNKLYLYNFDDEFEEKINVIKNHIKDFFNQLIDEFDEFDETTYNDNDDDETE